MGWLSRKPAPVEEFIHPCSLPALISPFWDWATEMIEFPEAFTRRRLRERYGDGSIWKCRQCGQLWEYSEGTWHRIDYDRMKELGWRLSFSDGPSQRYWIPPTALPGASKLPPAGAAGPTKPMLDAENIPAEKLEYCHATRRFADMMQKCTKTSEHLDDHDWEDIV